jgi:hypothetical protein
LGTVGEFFIPPGQRQHISNDDREVKKNEERTATGIVVRRNFDPTGTLEIYNIDSGTRVNRCKVKLVRQPSAALKAQIRALTPPNEVVAEDMILPIPRITQSSKRSLPPPADSPLDPSLPTEVTDTVEARGENDASGPEVEQAPQSTDADAPNDMPVVRSTDDTQQAAPSEEIETEKSSADNNDIVTDESEDVSQDQTSQRGVTGVPCNDAAPPATTTGSNTTPMTTSPLTDEYNTSVDNKQDFPRRPGLRKLTRKTQEPVPSTLPPPAKVRAQRSNAGRQPERYAHMAGQTTTIANQFQEYVYSAADNLTIAQAKQKYPVEHQESLKKELQQFHDMSVGKPIHKMVITGLKHNKIIGCRGFYKEIFDLRTGALKKLKYRTVPQGHLLDRGLYEPQETTSPTVSMESIFTCINIAAKENRFGFTMDIPGAYLNADLKDKHVVRFPKDLAAEYVALYPKFVEYLQPDGTMLILVEKAWYGLVESSALWYKELKGFLGGLGYVVHPSDMGVSSN